MEECDVGEGILPKDMVREYQLSDYRRAIYGIHFPKDKEEFYHARKRLVFEEFMLFILSLRMLKESEERVLNPYCFRKQPQIEKFLNSLPFELTDAQKTVWREIKNDMAGIHVMSRLVQGDVGSGKTIVALLAMMYTATKWISGCDDGTNRGFGKTTF